MAEKSSGESPISERSPSDRFDTETAITLPPAVGRAGEQSPDSSAEALGLPAGEILSHVRYDPRRCLARGGFGEVWDAIQNTLGRVIAIKRLRPEYAAKQPPVPGAPDHSHVRRAFISEALLTAFLEHPNIVPIYDLGRDADGNVVLAMKLIKGRPWEELISDDRRLPLPEILDRHLPTFMDMAQAVAFAHSRGVLHLDIKPSQVMVGEFGEVMLMDWGLAAVYDQVLFNPPSSDSDAWREIPGVGTFCGPAGTPAFMAPEQTGGQEFTIGPWTDVFLLGATLYLLLTGRSPHEAPTPTASVHKARMCAIIPPTVRAPERNVPQEFEDLCMRALSRDPGDRIGSVRELMDELRDLMTGARQRRESRFLAEEVEKALAHVGNDYRELTACEAQLERAKGLWFNNPAVPRLRNVLFDRHAQAAIENNDLVLARRMAHRLEDSPARQELLAEIGALESLDELERGEMESLERDRRSAELDLTSMRSHLAEARETMEGQEQILLERLRAAIAATDTSGDDRAFDRLEGFVDAVEPLLSSGSGYARDLLAQAARIVADWRDQR